MTDFRLLTDALEAHRDSLRGITYLDGGRPARPAPYRQLHARALGILGFLQRSGLGPGDELVLLVESNEQCIDAFWGCLMGGIVPVPVGVGIVDQHRHRLLRVFPRLRRPRLYTDRKNLARLAVFAQAHGAGQVYATIERQSVLLDDISAATAPGEPRPVEPGHTALIQFSSGSTSEPRGVVLSHRNLLANIDGIIRAAKITSADSTLSWMPLTHDMGLIGFHLTPLVLGLDMVLMATELFIRRPLAWLQHAAETRATLLSSPNFGYRHLLRALKPDKLAGVDLSAVRLIFNGAEPIDAELVDEFLTAMAPLGLDRRTMFPVYGLAEASLAVSFPDPAATVRSVPVDRHRLSPGEPVRRLPEAQGQALRLVSVGGPVPGCRFRIADGDGRALAEGCLGRVQIAGANVTAGYYADPAANAAAFTADGWLDTGDLGFVVDGELVIAGRRKEVILVNGQNYYPHDLEAAAASVEGVEIGKVAACALGRPGDPTDAVALFVVHRGALDTFPPRMKALRRRIHELAGLELAEILPVTQIPKTTSGKIQRYKLAQAYLDGQFEQVHAELSRLLAAPTERAAGARGEIERVLTEIWQSVVGDRPIGPDDNFFELGTSSLTLAQIYAEVEATWPGHLEITDLFDHPTIGQLAEFIATKAEAG
jgi:acyl-CoA synthetase (AMP-forming)/AMP-acid ligase II